MQKAHQENESIIICAGFCVDSESAMKKRSKEEKRNRKEKRQAPCGHCSAKEKMFRKIIKI